MPERPSTIGDCPSLSDLLLASEGGLSKRRIESVRDHVRRCAGCRDRLGEATSLINESAPDVLPAPLHVDDGGGASYDTFRARLRLESTRFSGRATFRLPRLAFRSWLPVAAAIPLIVISLLFSDRYTSTVKADELLAQALVRERATPSATVQRVQIRIKATKERDRTTDTAGAAAGAGHANARGVSRATTRALPIDGTLTRDVGQAAFVPVQTPTSAEQTLAEIFAAHHLDLADPLSVRHFQAWRASLTRKRDSIRFEREGTFVVLKTTTGEGDLRSAELVVRQADYHPVRQTLLFEDLGEIEVEEVSTWVAEPPRAAPAPVVAEAAKPIVPAALDRQALDDAELDARRVLHDTAADIEGHIYISRTARLVEVRGDVSAGRAAEVRARLRAVDLVHSLLKVVELDSPGIAVPAGLASWRARTFARSSDADRFLAALVEHIERLCALGAAYDRLATRYDEREVDRLSDRSQQKLQALVESYHRDVAKELEVVDTQLGLLIGSSTRPSIEPRLVGDWRGQSTRVRDAASQLRHTVQQLLHEDDLPLANRGERPDESSSLLAVRRAMNNLWTLFEASGDGS